MKLIKFIGNAVRGYMNFNITFRDSVTFLIGINGAGKTTVLKLLSGLLTPSYLDLVQIDFTTIELHCERNSDGREIVISCDKTDDELQIRYMDSTLKVPIVNKVPYSKKNSESRKTFYKTLDTERINNNVMLFEDTQVVYKIKQLNTPLFLGLNRRITDVKSRNHEFDIYFQQVERKHLDVSFDAVDEALRDIQDMFYDSVRRNARSQISISENFRKRIFAESFKICKPTEIINIDYSHELTLLEKRQTELNSAIIKLGIKDLQTQFAEYFTSIKQTLETLSNTPSMDETQESVNPEYFSALLDWMLNSNQIEKIDKIIGYANEYSNSIQRLKDPILRFTEGTNLFFKEGKKEIKVNEQGDIIVEIKGTKKTNSIYELSSGEKQLIIMLAHLAFCKNKGRRKIFIIDEPELSLHISWQEIFVDALLKTSPETQFVMATHAPSILAKQERKEWCEDLSK